MKKVLVPLTALALSIPLTGCVGGSATSLLQPLPPVQNQNQLEGFEDGDEEEADRDDFMRQRYLQQMENDAAARARRGY